MTDLCGAGSPPAGGLGGGRGRLPAEVPLVAAAVRKRLSLQGLKGHGAHGVAGHWARTHRHGYGDARGGGSECFEEGGEDLWNMSEGLKKRSTEREIGKQRKEWPDGLINGSHEFGKISGGLRGMKRRCLVEKEKKRKKALVLLIGSTTSNVMRPSLGN